MVDPRPQRVARLVLDANPLIAVDREKHRPLQRLLRGAAEAGRIAVPSLVLKRLARYRGRRRWASNFVRRHGSEIETTFQLNDEYLLFPEKKRLHPELATDDVQAVVIAKVRRWSLVTFESPMLRAADEQDIHAVDNLDDLQKVLEGRLL